MYQAQLSEDWFAFEPHGKGLLLSIQSASLKKEVLLVNQFARGCWGQVKVQPCRWPPGWTPALCSLYAPPPKPAHTRSEGWKAWRHACGQSQNRFVQWTPQFRPHVPCDP